VQVGVIEIKTLSEVRVPVVVRVLFAFLAVMVIGTLSIPAGWVDCLVAFSSPDDEVTRG